MSDIIVRYGRAMHLVDITPELAVEWLATLPAAQQWPGFSDILNQPATEGAPAEAGRILSRRLKTIDPGKVRRYAQAMITGTWKLMEMPIVYRNGRLLSSRHRLAAVIEAGITVPMYVSDDSCPR